MFLPRPPLLALALATVLAASGSAAAQTPDYASSVGAHDFNNTQPKSAPSTATAITWNAEAGVANTVEVVSTGLRAVIVSDAAGPVQPLDGCGPLPGGRALCQVSSGGMTVDVLAGDGDDRLRVAVDGAGVIVDGGDGNDEIVHAGSTYGAQLDGGPGDDVIVGGPRGETIRGGAGADRIDGGDSIDTIIDDPPEGPYAPDVIAGGAPEGGRAEQGGDIVVYGRAGGVHVDLGAGFGGAPGEGDRLSGIESVDGGSGDDLLIGDDGVNVFNYGTRTGLGRAGADRVEGRGGGDTLYGGRRSLLLAGDGDDRIAAFSGGVVNCGAGEDTVERVLIESPLTACERFGLADATLSDLRADGRRLRVTLDGGYRLRAPMCGFRIEVRDARLRPLAHRIVRLRPTRLRPRAVTLRAAEPLPQRLAVVAQILSCRHGAPRSGSRHRGDGFLWERAGIAAPPTLLPSSRPTR